MNGRAISMHISFNPASGKERINVEVGERCNARRPIAECTLSAIIAGLEASDYIVHDRGHKSSNNLIQTSTWVKISPSPGIMRNNPFNGGGNDKDGDGK